MRITHITLTLICCGLLLTGCRHGQRPILPRPSTTVLPATAMNDTAGSYSISDETNLQASTPHFEQTAQREIKAKPIIASNSHKSAQPSFRIDQQIQPASFFQATDAGSPSDLIPEPKSNTPLAKPEQIAPDPGAIPGGPQYPKQMLGQGMNFPPAPTMVLGQDCGPCGGACDACGPCGVNNNPLAKNQCGTNWRPEGIACPWPSDEYLCDGGDNEAGVRVSGDWTVRGLDIEDTVAHYDTLAGEIKVQPSNRVCVYAPRFAAVRRVDALYSGDAHVKATGTHRPIGPTPITENQLVGTDSQPVPAVGEVGRKRVTIYESEDRGTPVVQNTRVLAEQDRIKPALDFDRLLARRLEENMKPFLAKQAQAALFWTRNQMVQAIIEGKKAFGQVASEHAMATYSVETGKPRLRLVKAVSTESANPGDIIEFVLRYENIGEQTIGNVTLIDSLTTRLEYVPNSQHSSLKANFLTTENHGESSILRWEIEEPIKPGEGGVIVFKCKVR
jgi:uncharacterized repeat protein (TIGR01451 family)